MKAFIRAVGSYVPPRRVSNDELAETLDTSDEWIYSHTGIKYRHIAEEDRAASDLAFEASKKVLQKSAAGPDEIDLILTATSTPDYPGLPSTACVLQDKLKAVHAGAMDLSAACTGFIYALETAHAFIRAGIYRNILVAGTEVFSKILNWRDRNTCVLFGDGAGVVLVSAAEENAESGILFSSLKSQGRDACSLYRPAGGSRNPFIPGTTDEEELYLHMDGRKVYNFAVKTLGNTILELLETAGVSMDKVRWIVPHQANVRIIDAAVKRAGLPKEKFYMNIEEYANTSAASIPIALDEMNEKGLLERGDYVVSVGFGGGLTSGGNIFRW